ncbi:MAG: type II secretion system protein, partial [Chloroflexota bacterium]|nr:type II secretion system protein [Chloroflexota bacterium]
MFKSFNLEFTKTNKQASFTLIELLVVIAVLAILMGAIVITLNPQEMLKKGRDAKRISELKSINTALGIYQANKPTISMGNASTTYVSIPAINSNCSDLGLPTPPSSYSYSCSTSANYKKTDGTGWIPVNFNSLDIGSPLFTLPTDPTNSTSTGLYYTYTTGGSWELTSTLESNIYKMGGDNDRASKDGGIYPELYEV